MSKKFRFQELVQRYTEGQASAEEVKRLDNELRESAAARRDFISLMNLDSALESVSTEWIGAARASNRPMPAAKPRILVRKKFLAAIAVCLALLVVNGWWDQYKHRIYATVENGTGVPELTDGTMLRDEWIEIAGGTLELSTPTAARIVIEAPATFRFESPQRLSMKRGRLAADIPPSARKFTVVTPSGEAVDLGTKFGVDVPLRAEAEVHVFQGEVIAQSSNGGKRKNLHTGEAFRLKSGAGNSQQLRSAAFIRPDEISSLHAALWAGQPLRSGEALYQLQQDPALIALLDFESPSQLPDGTYDSVQGRWPRSRAAEVVKKGDHIRLDLQGRGEWPQLTLAAWVRLDQFSNAPQSLFHTESRNNNEGRIDWMVTEERRMRLSVSGMTSPEKGNNPDAETVFPDSRSPVLKQEGRWVHLAVVYDAPSRTVRFYLNGKLDNKVTLETASPARLGIAEIGNWNQADQKLSGRIDEFLVLGRAMSDKEVRELFAAGNPYR